MQEKVNVALTRRFRHLDSRIVPGADKASFLTVSVVTVVITDSVRW